MASMTRRSPWPMFTDISWAVEVDDPAPLRRVQVDALGVIDRDRVERSLDGPAEERVGPCEPDDLLRRQVVGRGAGGHRVILSARRRAPRAGPMERHYSTPVSDSGRRAGPRGGPGVWVGVTVRRRAGSASWWAGSPTQGPSAARRRPRPARRNRQEAELGSQGGRSPPGEPGCSIPPHSGGARGPPAAVTTPEVSDAANRPRRAPAGDLDRRQGVDDPEARGLRPRGGEGRAPR